jgi:para-aminobenzoate synthetase/4-amino-4-deoxychorismate lyase
MDDLAAGGATPLLLDVDGSVLEAGYAAVLLLHGDRLTAPPLDGRILPSISRETVISQARESGLEVVIESFSLRDAVGADAVILTSSLRGPHAGLLDGGPGIEAADRFRATLRATTGSWIATAV